MYSILLATLMVASSSPSPNLMCNGSFQAVSTIEFENSQKIWAGIVIHNIESCWSSSDSSNWWIVEYPKQNTTKCLLLQQKICQMVRLTPNLEYRLQFDVFSLPQITKVVFKIELNAVSMFTHAMSAANGNQTVLFSFLATAEMNQFCFQEEHVCILNRSCTFLDHGMIDNISLTLSPQAATDQFIYVNFQVRCRQNESMIILNSNISSSGELAAHVRSHLEIKIQNKIQREIQYTKSNNGNVVAFFNISKASDLSTIEVVIPNQTNNNISIIFRISIKHLQTYYLSLTPEEKQVIRDLEAPAKELSSAITIYQSLMSSFFCTYFILGLINFWNVSLLYYFVMIKTMPLFVRDLMKQSVQFFYTNISLFTWLPEQLQPSNDFIFFTLENSVPQLMAASRDGYEWFLVYSFSSKIITNNFEGFLTYTLLIVRILVVQLIMRLLPNGNSNVYWKKLKQFNYSAILIKQVLGMTPFLLISAFTSLFSSSSSSLERVERVGQICIILIVQICYISFLLSFPKRGCSKKQQGRMQIIHECNEIYCEFNEYLLGFTTPLLVVLGSPLLFLVVNALVIVYTLLDFIRRFHAIRRCTKFFGSFRILTWLLFHASFIVFYCLEVYVNVFGNPEILYIATKFGFVVIISLLTGGGLEILRSFVQILIFSYTYLKLVWKRNGNKIISKQSPVSNEVSKVLDAKTKKPEEKQDFSFIDQKQANLTLYSLSCSKDKKIQIPSSCNEKNKKRQVVCLSHGKDKKIQIVSCLKKRKIPLNITKAAQEQSIQEQIELELPAEPNSCESQNTEKFHIEETPKSVHNEKIKKKVRESSIYDLQKILLRGKSRRAKKKQKQHREQKFID